MKVWTWGGSMVKPKEPYIIPGMQYKARVLGYLCHAHHLCHAPWTDPVGNILSVMPFSSFMSCSLHRLNQLVISYLFMSPSFVSCSLHRQRGNYWIWSKHLGKQCQEFLIPSSQITYDFLYHCLSTVFGPHPFQTSKSELPWWQWFQTQGCLVPSYKLMDQVSCTNELLLLSVSLLFQQEIVMASVRLWHPQHDKSLILFAGSSVSYLLPRLNKFVLFQYHFALPPVLQDPLNHMPLNPNSKIDNPPFHSLIQSTPYP